MKIKYLLTSILACLTLLVGCKPEELPSLSNVSAEPTLFTLPIEGGSVVVNVTATDKWTITDIPEWLSVNPTSGNSGATKVTVSAEPTTSLKILEAVLNLKCGNETQMITVSQLAFIPDYPIFEGGKYWITFPVEGGKYIAAKPVTGAAYGYLYTSDCETDEAGNIISKADYIFTFTPVEGGGFTMQDAAGQYYYMHGTYDSFNVQETLPEAGGIWDVVQVADNAFNLINTGNGKVMQYDPNYSSAGAYSGERGVKPYLAKYVELPEPEPIGDASTIKDAAGAEPMVVVEGVVNAVSSKGVIVNDETGSIFLDGIQLDLGTKAKFEGKLSSYRQGYQIVEARYEIIDTVEVVHPEVTELNSMHITNLVAQPEFLSYYVSAKGIVSTDNYNNANIAIGDYIVKSYYSNDSYADYKDKAVELKGYVVNYKAETAELNVMVTSIEEIEDWEPEETIMPIAEALKLAKDEDLLVQGIVTAMASNGPIITDATGSIYAYKLSGVELGDEVKVAGKMGFYNKGCQIASPVAEKISSGNKVEYPTPATLTEAKIAEIVAPEVIVPVYATVTGVAATDSYNNAIVAVGDYKVKSYYGTESYADFADKNVTVKGYVISYKESAKEVNILVTSVEEAGAEPTIADVLKKDLIDQEIVVNGVVSALTTNGAVISDNSASIFAYKLSDVKVGDAVKVSGKLSTYNKGYQIGSPKAEVISSNNAVTFPTSTVELTAEKIAEIGALEYIAPIYATVTGVAATDSYKNAIVTVGDYTVKSYYGVDPYDSYDGKNVKLTGYVISYNKNTANMIVTAIEEVGGGSGEGGEGGEGGDALTHPLTSNVTWENGEKAYTDSTTTVNGTPDVVSLKLGTSSVVGNATIKVPAGTKTLSFYGVAWKGKEGEITMKVGETVVLTKGLVSNDGATGNPPYVITASDSDYYTVDLSAVATSDVDLVVSTSQGKTRVILWGINATK